MPNLSMARSDCGTCIDGASFVSQASWHYSRVVLHCLRLSTISKACYFCHHVSIIEALLLGLCVGDLTGKHACSKFLCICLPPEADGFRPLCLQAAVHAQEEEEMGVTDEQAYAPITYNDGSSIDFQDKTLLNLTLERESKCWMYRSRMTWCSDSYGVA